MNTFAKGQQVVISHGSDTWNGKIVRYVGKTVQGPHMVMTDEGEAAWFTIDQINALPVEHELAIAADDLYELSREVVELREQAATWSKRYDYAIDFINTVSERLIEEADNRNWCSEYDDIVDEVNAKSGMPGVIMLREREHEYTVSVRIEARVNVETEVKVMARSQEHADDLVNEDVEACLDESVSDIISEEVRYNGVYDYDVEVY